jgi:hypothetical protein
MEENLGRKARICTQQASVSEHNAKTGMEQSEQLSAVSHSVTPEA